MLLRSSINKSLFRTLRDGFDCHLQRRVQAHGRG
ncbi:hypothetical protein EV672_1143 [Aquabacterium commune]|uniref:Uncharacterized protein n=1 Tax=Aquabacterium commune TaxID=70586 RepID=A0A4R6R181_9BURK|nr:hypothetical protein EV672_1143 [Aquabacterium commune]